MLTESAPGLLPLLSAGEMQAQERLWFSAPDLDERVVMESAGRAAALAVATNFPEGRIVAAVGKGNNGGDAVVALRTLAALGRDVSAVSLSGTLDPGLTHGWDIPVVSPDSEHCFDGAGVVIDGLLGTGSSGPPREPVASLIAAIRACGAPVLALDGPSGVDLDTGATPGEAVHASITVTFGALKRGLLLHPGRQCAGRILLAEVGFPPLPPDLGTAAVIGYRWALRNLPDVPGNAHKSTAGIVAVAAGTKGMAGAALMAAVSALRAGSGGVRIISAEANRLVVQSALPEAIFYDRNVADLAEVASAAKAVLVGPGIGTDDAAGHLLMGMLDLGMPTAIDADALSLIAAHPDLLPAGHLDQLLLTPHPGELARLLGVPLPEVLEDRFAAAENAARRYGCAILAKGAPSLVAYPGQPHLVSVTGHSGVATAGMGDTLTGVAVALLARGLEPRLAGALAIHFAGRAADIAGRGRGLLPRDVAEAIPEALSAAPPPAPFPPFLFDLGAAV